MKKLRIKQESNTKNACRLLIGILMAFTVSSLFAQDSKPPNLKGLTSDKCEKLFSNTSLVAREEKQAIPNNASVSIHPSQTENSSSSVLEIYSTINAQAKTRGELLLGRDLTERQAQALVNLTSPIWEKRVEYLNNRPNTAPAAETSQSLVTKDQALVLKQAGFSEREIEQILSLENGMSPFLPDLEAPQMALAKKIQEGEALSPNEKPLIFISGLRNYLARAVKIDGPKKISIEFPNPETGDLDRMTLHNIIVSETMEGRENIHKRVKSWESFTSEDARDFTFAGGMSVSFDIFATGDFNESYQAIMSREFFQNLSAETKIFSGKHMVKAFDPMAGQIFAAYQSDRKILSLAELNLQMEIPSESDPSHIEGSIHPEIQEQIAFARAVRSLAKPPHPHHTHIEYLALKIPSRIEYAKQILTRDKESSATDIQQALSLLKDLEDQALLAIQQNKVSYVWWLAFNYNLSSLVSGGFSSLGDAITGANSKEIKSYKKILKASAGAVARAVAHFPYRITLPVMVWEGDLNKKSLALAVLNNVRPVAFSSSAVKINGYNFMKHDFYHIETADDPLYFVNVAHKISPLSVSRDLGAHQFIKTSGVIESWINEDPSFAYDLLGVYD